MSKVYISKEVKFCAAHRLHNPTLSDAENEVLYGKCNNYHGHGHNYILVVTFVGEINPITGMLLNFDEIERLLHQYIIAKFDHKNIDKEIPEFKQRASTAENIAIVCWQILAQIKISAKLYKVVVKELDDCTVEYYGD